MPPKITKSGFCKPAIAAAVAPTFVPLLSSMNTTPFFSPIFSTRCGRPWKVLTCSSNASRGKPTASHKATAAITLAALCKPCSGMSCVAIKSSLPCFRRPVSRSSQKSASCSKENHFTSRPARFIARQNTSSEFKTCTPSPRKILAFVCA